MSTDIHSSREPAASADDSPDGSPGSDAAGAAAPHRHHAHELLQSLSLPPVDAGADEPRQGVDKVIFGVTARHRHRLRGLGLPRDGQPGHRLPAPSTGSWTTPAGSSCCWLALRRLRPVAGRGRFGNIPLGKDGEKPEFRTVSWVAMMFGAGMGIGLMFYGVAEPLYHYVSPPPGTVDGRDRRGHPDRHGHHDLPLDPAPVGDVRGRRHRHGLRHLPPGPQATDLRGLHPAARVTTAERPGRQGHQHPGDLRHAVRFGRVAGPRRPADRQRPGVQRLASARSAPPCSWSSSPS